MNIEITTLLINNIYQELWQYFFLMVLAPYWGVNKDFPKCSLNLALLSNGQWSKWHKPKHLTIYFRYNNHLPSNKNVAEVNSQILNDEIIQTWHILFLHGQQFRRTAIAVWWAYPVLYVHLEQVPNIFRNDWKMGNLNYIVLLYRFTIPEVWDKEL